MSKHIKILQFIPQKSIAIFCCFTYTINELISSVWRHVKAVLCYDAQKGITADSQHKTALNFYRVICCSVLELRRTRNINKFVALAV